MRAELRPEVRVSRSREAAETSWVFGMCQPQARLDACTPVRWVQVDLRTPGCGATAGVCDELFTNRP
jgi:hypothetical protein